MKTPEVPLYMAIVADLKTRIEGNILSVGDRLPSHADLAREYGVSHITIQAALKVLTHSGHVQGRRGSGVFVAFRSTERPARLRSLMRDSVVVLAPYKAAIMHRPHEGGWVQNVTAGALQEISESGLHQVVMHPDRLCGETIEILADDPPLGVVIPESFETSQVSSWAVQLTSLGIPVVVRDDCPEYAGFDRVTSDYVSGSFDLTTHFIGQGKRRIAQAWPEWTDGFWFEGLRTGHVRAMEAAGLTPLPVMRFDHEREPSTNLAGFQRAVRQIAGCLPEYMIGPEPLDAILVASDGFFFVFAAACRLYGRTPNVDIAIAGYDDYWAGNAQCQFETSVPAATVDKRNVDIGAEMVRLLNDRIEGRLPSEAQCRILKPTLLVPTQV